MKRISVLDCTLRDGGYVNNFEFGELTIKDIIQKLSKASIDIIECGFLKSGATNPNCSVFGSIEALSNVIQKKNNNLLYVGMIQYGAISYDEISEYDGTSIDGIRLTFHEHEIEPSFELGYKLKTKGYKVFMQPVGTTTYTDDSLLELIKRVNELHPYAFYLVDTLGVMYKNDLRRMYYLVDHNLDNGIVLGFHSHNNLQLSFANAQELMQMNTSRKIIIDSSILGMGRGAGNLNTELVIHYINKNFGLRYDNMEVLEIMDKYIKPIKNVYTWGYDAPYYIASINGCHPNYGTFLMNKQTLHIQDIQAILSRLSIEKRALFDEDYIAQEYYKYQDYYIDDTYSLKIIRDLIGEKPVMLLAPGKSLNNYSELVANKVDYTKYYIISINFIPNNIDVDAVFSSNIRRFSGLKELKNRAKGIRVIVTSNVSRNNSEGIMIVNYSSYTNEEAIIVDNAGLMCINLLKKIGVDSIILVGFDGFSKEMGDNYYESSMWIDVSTERLIEMNLAISRKMTQLSKQMSISFLTETMYKNHADKKE